MILRFFIFALLLSHVQIMQASLQEAMAEYAVSQKQIDELQYTNLEDPNPENKAIKDINFSLQFISLIEELEKKPGISNILKNNVQITESPEDRELRQSLIIKMEKCNTIKNNIREIATRQQNKLVEYKLAQVLTLTAEIVHEIVEKQVHKK